MRRVKPKYFKRKPAVKYSRFDSSLSSIDHEIRRLKIVSGSIVAGLIIFFSILTNQWATFFSLHVSLPSLQFDQIFHSIPSLPQFALPNLSFDWFHIPLFALPDFHLPSFPAFHLPALPAVQAPEMPRVSLPHVYLPQISFSLRDVFLTILAFFQTILHAILHGIFAILHFLDPRPIIFGIVRWFLTKITDGIIAGNTMIQPLMPFFVLLRTSFFQTLISLSEGLHLLNTILSYLLSSHS